MKLLNKFLSVKPVESVEIINENEYDRLLWSKWK